MWGDSTLATAQLLRDRHLDYITYECLAEITMAILTRARQKDPEAGYATDVITDLIPRHMPEIAARGIRVITNAGGVNPQAAARALRHRLSGMGLSLKVATVCGDDALPHLAALRALKLHAIDSGAPLPEAPISANAYLGAFPIAAALAAGADIVITGRVVDSALTLGALIHEFGWGPGDLDRLAQGALAGHLIECGPQSTGGLVTDWDEVASWADVGFPIVRVAADGAFVLTKPPGSDGQVSDKSATEQLLYEIGDPAAYLLPDVSCDFTGVRIAQISENRVQVSGARGRAAPPMLKLCTQEAEGWRLQWLVSVVGRDAVARARRTGRDLMRRLRGMLREAGMADFADTSLEILGSEDSYGPHGRAETAREVVLKIALAHGDAAALRLAAREMPSIGLAMAQGLSAGGAGRPRPSPIIRLQSFLVPRAPFVPRVELEGVAVDFADPVGGSGEEIARSVPDPDHAPRPPAGATVTLPLMAIAYARSGDKGNRANIGLAARHEDFVALIDEQIPATAVADWFAHLVAGRVERYALPGVMGFNYLLFDALGGGGTASLRFDPQGKALGQMLLDLPIELPQDWLDHPGLKSIREVQAARAGRSPSR